MIQDAELNEVLSSFKQAIDLIVLKIENLEKRSVITEEAVKNLEQTFIKDIYEPAQKAFDEAIDAENFKLFSDKYHDRLSPFEAGIKAVEGDDFDLTRHAYDEFNALEDKTITADEYIDRLVPSIENQLNAIREKLGATKVEAEVKSNGEVEIKADGEKIENPTDVPTDVPPASDKDQDVKVEQFAEQVLDDPEEIAKFERELAASLKK